MTSGLKPYDAPIFDGEAFNEHQLLVNKAQDVLTTPKSPRIPDLFKDLNIKLSTEVAPNPRLYIVENNLPLSTDTNDLCDKMRQIKDMAERGVFQTLIEQAKKNQNEVVVSLSGIRIYISKLGRIRARVDVVGSGKFKISNKLRLIATPFDKDFSNQNKLIRICSVTKSTFGVNPFCDATLKNEIDVNLALKLYKKAKRGSLSHVLVSKKVINLNTGQLGIVSKFCNGGDFDHLIRSVELETMPLKEKYRLCAQMAKGVLQLHQAGVVHRDLHTGNILVTRDFFGRIKDIKIADFGLASLMELDKRYYPHQLLLWLLPYGCLAKERLTTEELYDPKIDVHELGISYYLIFTGVKQCEIPTIMSQNKEKDADGWIRFSTIPIEVQTIIKKMIQVNAAARPGMAEIVADFKQLIK